MRKVLAFAIAMLSSAACMAQTEPVPSEPLMLAAADPAPPLANSARRATVPRSAEVGLDNVPTGGGGGISRKAAVLIGIVVVGGIIAAVAADDDDDAPQGTGTGTGTGTGGS